MDVIDRAIEQKLHITNHKKLKGQTWQEFERVAGQKQVWIFGAGKAAGLFWEKYHCSIPVCGVIDNDIRKQGKELKKYVGITEGTSAGELVICGSEVLSQNKLEKMIFVISSVRYYEEIAEQLERIGAVHIFSMVVMEANETKYKEQREKNIDAPVLQKEDAYAVECMKYPIEENKILVYVGILGSHGKQISRRLIEKKPDLDIVWIVENQDTEIPEGIRSIQAGSWKEYIKELETARVWIYGEDIPLFAKKRSGQIYIQTKHWASITLKSFGWDSENHAMLSGVRKICRHNSEAIDYIFVGSDFDEKSCRRGFRFDGTCVHIGSPRTDILFQPHIKEKVYSFYGIHPDVHVLLYSPTFRAAGNGSVMARMKYVDLDFESLEKTLKKKFGGEWVIFLRVHPCVAVESAKVQRPSYVIDASYYDESQELVAASDIVITDYSSIMFEPAFIGRPVFLYAPDKEVYVGKERGLLLDYDALPFSVSETNEELLKQIEKFNMEDYSNRVNRFFDFYDVHEDGHASKRAAEFVLKCLSGKS